VPYLSRIAQFGRAEEGNSVAKADRPREPDENGSPKPVEITLHGVVAGSDVKIANLMASDIVGHDSIIIASTNIPNPDIFTEITLEQFRADLSKREAEIRSELETSLKRPKEILSSEQALGRIADAVRLNLGQLQLNMEQARRESSQFFRTTMIFSGIAFVIILGGIGLMLANLVTVGIVTTAASIIPEAGALLLFNKDKELRKTIETYHSHILESQRVLTMIDLAETMAETAAKDSVKEQIIFAVLQVNPPKGAGAREPRGKPRDADVHGRGRVA
jgi:hypothetical protein